MAEVKNITVRYSHNRQDHFFHKTQQYPFNYL